MIKIPRDNAEEQPKIYIITNTARLCSHKRNTQHILPQKLIRC